ncbi:MAG: DUF349 domain-containing protein [Prevotellaceae bacterium]|nr:DUF349 domain-containing protein [Candidatus Faecinaster equi]
MEDVLNNGTEELTQQNPVEQPVEASAQAEEMVESAECAPETKNENNNESEPQTPEEEPVALEEEEEEKEYAIPQSKTEILERLDALCQNAGQSEKAELDILKQSFYKFLRDERATALAKFVEGGGSAEEFEPEPDESEKTFKDLMGIIKKERAKILEEENKLREANLEKKKNIIEQIKALASTPDEASANYDTFNKLQKEWKEINPIPVTATNEIWKSFHFCIEQYYDLLKTNSALRDYDFKKNLEAKTALCEAAEKLAEDNDVIGTAHQLQQLHQEFREIGPVAKELREDLWNRFKAASTVINKRHAQYFEELKAKEEENLKQKTSICEEVENYQTDNLTKFTDWEKISQQIISLQQQWKTIGRAPKKVNTKIYERFRVACDNFFNKKSEFFKTQKKLFADNAALRTALCEKAEALKESTAWAKTTNELVKLQKEWKELGPTTQKVSNALWERFNTACNFFFDQKKQVLGDQHKEENENLTHKQTIIEKLEALMIEGGEGIAEKVKALSDEWVAVGHVPFKEKDKIYEKYHAVIKKLNKEFKLRTSKFAEKYNDNDEASLMRKYEAKKAELATYENNITFLTAHSKSGNALIGNMTHKIENLKDEIEAIVDKINELKAAKAEQENG